MGIDFVFLFHVVGGRHGDLAAPCQGHHAEGSNQSQHRVDGPMEEVLPLLEKAHKAGKGIIGMKLIGEGSFDLKKRKAALKFVMDLGTVDAMTVGFEQPEQIDEFLANVKERLVAKAQS